MSESSAGEREVIHLREINLESPMVGNNVLIKIPYVPEDGHVMDSGIIVGGSKWDEGGHVARHGTVAKVPTRLSLKTKEHKEGMEWGTEIEIEPGDEVYFGKIASANAPAILVGDDLYYVMKYSELILRERDGEMYPLNGYAIVEKVIESMKVSGLSLDFGSFQDKQRGVVRAIGRANDFYYDEDAVDADVDVGDHVVFRHSFWTELENEIFATLEGELGFVQRCWIDGKL